MKNPCEFPHEGEEAFHRQLFEDPQFRETVAAWAMADVRAEASEKTADFPKEVQRSVFEIIDRVEQDMAHNYLLTHASDVEELAHTPTPVLLAKTALSFIREYAYPVARVVIVIGLLVYGIRFYISLFN